MEEIKVERKESQLSAEIRKASEDSKKSWRKLSPENRRKYVRLSMILSQQLSDDRIGLFEESRLVRLARETLSEIRRSDK